MAQLLDGNLCRCTGYQPIFQAAADALLAPSVADYDDDDELIFPSWLQLNIPKVRFEFLLFLGRQFLLFNFPSHF